MGLEVVVRPVVFPNIRPQQARSLPPEDDPTKGICEIKGTSSFVVQFSNSTSWSVTYGKSKEIKRRVDEVRVYQQEDDGTVNRENYVDIDIPNKLWMRGPAEPTSSIVPTEGEPEPDATRASMNRVDIEYYRPVQEAENIEVTKKNVIKRSGEEFTP